MFRIFVCLVDGAASKKVKLAAKELLANLGAAAPELLAEGMVVEQEQEPSWELPPDMQEYK